MVKMFLLLAVVVISSLALADDLIDFRKATLYEYLAYGPAGFGVGALTIDSSVSGAFLSFTGPLKWDTGFVQKTDEMKVFSTIEALFPSIGVIYTGLGGGVAAGVVSGKFNPEFLVSAIAGIRLWRLDAFIRFQAGLGFLGFRTATYLGINFIWLGGLDDDSYEGLYDEN
ncbi:MAG TPA: hypothetical protein PK411_13380 [Mesotoga infera]|nr:hypothetical protein [Mesotoga infera]HPD39331.1 hypothetical protein [Mesotoga infera]